MKKIVALMLVLCMMLAAIPVFAESAEEQAPAASGLGDLLSGLLGGSENGEGKERTVCRSGNPGRRFADWMQEHCGSPENGGT